MSDKFETKPGVRIPKPEDTRPKRFYTTVTVEPAEGGYAVLLDGRSVKTPAKMALVLPSEALAGLIAAEWEAQGERIDAPSMPATRLCFVALDRLAVTREDTAAEVTKYASTDLLCFRAPEPPELVAAQAAAWDPMLDWAKETLGVTLVSATGLLPVEQDPVALTLVHNRARELDDIALTALAHATAVCGSAVLSLALLEDRIDGETAFALSTVDEHFQLSQWGEDEEARERLDNLRTELVAVEKVLRAL